MLQVCYEYFLDENSNSISMFGFSALFTDVVCFRYFMTWQLKSTVNLFPYLDSLQLQLRTLRVQMVYRIISLIHVY